MALLTREQILEAEDLKFEKVDVPEWGGEVLIWELTGAERSEYESSIMQRTGGEMTLDIRNYQSKLLAMSIKDAEGNRLFDSSQIAELAGKAAAPLTRLFLIAQRVSAISEGEVESMMGKSGTPLNDAGTSL